MPDKNAIKLTIDVKDGPSIKSYHHTKAIKSGDKFALLFIKRAPYLNDDHFLVTRPSKQDISIGSYDPTEHTLLFAVAVSAPGLEFTIPKKGMPEIVSIKQADIGAYGITVISTLLNISSTNTGTLLHVMTYSPEEDISDEQREISSQAEEGGSASQIFANIIKGFGDLSQSMFGEIAEMTGRSIEEVLSINNRTLRFSPVHNMQYLYISKIIDLTNSIYNQFFDKNKQ